MGVNQLWTLPSSHEANCETVQQYRSSRSQKQEEFANVSTLWHDWGHRSLALLDRPRRLQLEVQQEQFFKEHHLWEKMLQLWRRGETMPMPERSTASTMPLDAIQGESKVFCPSEAKSSQRYDQPITKSAVQIAELFPSRFRTRWCRVRRRVDDHWLNDHVHHNIRSTKRDLWTKTKRNAKNGNCAITSSSQGYAPNQWVGALSTRTAQFWSADCDFNRLRSHERVIFRIFLYIHNPASLILVE